ncbi:unnamed protein product [Chironomus riparius]|uniref:Aquaporin n=1 Tax=Chironomus riparius TaxID=315576 RepID=A0A9N9WXP3_9DIPT|nr:unnamed protein product [Chironomus riparius]
MKTFKNPESFEMNEIQFNIEGLQKNPKTVFRDKLIMIFGEFVGTAMLVFFGCIGCIDWGNLSSITAPLNFGLVVMFLTQIFGHYTYAVFNPSVTIAATICRIIDIKLGILYILTQLAGATIGYGLLKLLIPLNFIPADHCTTQPLDSISSVQAFLIEFFLTSALILISCSHWDPRNRHNSDSIPLRMGLTVAGLGITGGHLTGASMNPARTFGPAIWNGQWNSHWIYWIAPLSSGFFSAFLYKFVFWNKNPKDSVGSLKS